MVIGKVSVEWLLATVEVEALVQGEGLKDFFKYSRVGSKSFLVQRCLNNHGRFLVLEYRDGGWRGFIAIPKGREEKDINVVPLGCERWRLFLSCLSAKEGRSAISASVVLSHSFWVALPRCLCLRLWWGW